MNISVRFQISDLMQELGATARDVRPILDEWTNATKDMIALAAERKNMHPGRFYDKYDPQKIRYRHSGAPHNKIRRLSGRLSRSLYSGAAEGFEKRTHQRLGRIKFDVGSRVPYASLQEFGGVLRVTPRMKRFFLKMYKDSNKTIKPWMYMAFAPILRVPARPYLAPAINEVIPRSTELLRRLIEARLESRLRKRRARLATRL